jgi:predicted methyltransferase
MVASTSSRPRWQRIALWSSAAVAGLVLLAAAALGAAVVKLDYTRIASRDGWQRPDRVLRTLALRPGDRVADVGAGGGYFAFRLARAVGPRGRVYAVELDPAAVRGLAAGARQRGLANVQAVQAAADDPRLPPRALDRVLLCNAYHHLGSRPAYLRRLAASLRPGGRIAILELRPVPLMRLIGHGGHVSSEAGIRREAAAAGLRVVARHDFLPFQSFVELAE